MLTLISRKQFGTNVKEGSVLEITYKVTSDFLFNFQNWEFQTTIPTRWSEYRARIPEYFNYEKYMQGYVTLSVNENKMQPTSFTVTSKERSGGSGFTTTSTTFNQDKIDYQENQFRWAAKDVPAFKKEPFITTPKDYISKMNFELSYTNFPQQFSHPGIKQYMGTWDDINKTYWERLETEITGSNSLKNQVEKIVTGLTTSDQKVNAIFNYVRQNVLWDENYQKFSREFSKEDLGGKKGKLG